MARRAEKTPVKGKKSKQRRRRGRFLPILLLLVLLAGGFFGWMHMQARISHLRKAEVYLEDLPEGMDGLTLLYVSDLNIRSAADLRACTKLMEKLAQVQPDVLLLGGDYSAPGMLDELNGSQGLAQKEAAQFIAGLADFPAPYGKFAVTGENDTGNSMLAEAFGRAGIQQLDDACAAIERGGAQLVLAGLSDISLNKTPYNDLGKHFTGEECVVVLAHNPAAYVNIRVNEARNGGAWADLVLSGHTLGGQIKIFNRSLREFTPEEARCMGGWYYVDDLPMLVSTGVGCEGPMLRLGTQSETWLLTLRCQETLTLPDFE